VTSPRYQQVGLPAAVQTAATIAAPVLAGFCITLIGLVLTITDIVRWSGAVVTVLVTSVLLLIVSTQFGINSRADFISPTEESDWFGTTPIPPTDARLTRAIRLSNVAAGTYNAGLVLLLDAVALLVVPTERIPPSRWVAIAVALVAAGGETVWLVWDQLQDGKYFVARLHGALQLGVPTLAALLVAITAPANSWALPAAALLVTCAGCVTLAFRSNPTKRVVCILTAIVLAAAIVLVLVGDRPVDIVVTVVAVAVVFFSAVVLLVEDKTIQREPSSVT
jgi:hypothetical protein